jgi:TP901 family phage tail tape measure protein
MPLNVGTLFATLDLDANPFTKNLGRTMSDAERQGERMSQIGGKLTKGLTLPLVAAGGAAAKLSMDFETSFSRMVGLAGVPADEVDGLRQSVLDLAGETAQAPQELADALYEAASAGLDSGQAMDAVTVAAKGAAAGLGSTRDIVGLVASAVASYGEANIDAAEATDILTATIRAGRADPAELAGTLGRVLPIASQLGVSFDEVGGTVAYLSNVFGDTNRTVTATQGLLTKLLSPSQQGRKALEDMGTSVEELQGAISERGLLGALDLLRERGFGENQQALASLFDDIEGRQAALALLGDESGKLAEILGETAGSAGALEEALGEAMGTDAQKAKQAIVDVQVSLIELGQTLLPLVGNIAEFVSAFLSWFDKLPGPLKTLVVAFGGVLAALGPMISVAGNVRKAIEVLPKIFDRISTGAHSAAGNLGSLTRTLGTGAAAIGVGVAAWQLYGQVMDDAKDRGKSAVDSLREQFAGVDPASMSMDKLRGIISAMDGDLQSLSDTIAGSQAPWDADKRAEMKAQREEGEKLRGEWKALEEQAEGLAAEMGVSTDEALRSILANEDLAAAAADTSKEFDEQAAAVQIAGDELEGYANQLKAMFDPIFAMQDAIAGEEEARRALSDAIRDHGPASEEATAAQDELTRAMVDTDSAALNLQQAVLAGDVSMADFRTQLDLWVAQGRITQEAADTLAGKVEGLTGKAEEYAGTYKATFEADTTTAEGRIAALKHSIATVPKTVPVGFIGPLLPGQSRAPGPVQTRDSGGPVDGPLGSPQMVLAHAGEIVLPTHRMGLGEALQHTLGISTTSPAGAAQGGGRVVNIGEMNLQTTESPRQWFDEGLWRVAGPS